MSDPLIEAAARRNVRAMAGEQIAQEIEAQRQRCDEHWPMPKGDCSACQRHGAFTRAARIARGARCDCEGRGQCAGCHSEDFLIGTRVIGRLGEQGTVVCTYDDGSVLVKLDLPPQNRVRYTPVDLRRSDDNG